VVLILGEVWTTALAHASAAPLALAEQVLALRLGDRVSLTQRPITHAVSRELFVGIDCGIPEMSGALETVGKADQTSLRDAHLAADRTRSTMGMSAFCDSVLAMVQRSPLLDGDSPLKAGRTVLWWAAQSEPDPQKRWVRFTLGEDSLRTLSLVWDLPGVGDIVELCEDVARHDWLLTTVSAIAERVQPDPGDVGASNKFARRAQAVRELQHLWMPDARLSALVREAWHALERRPGFSR
jgi:hypothetical protein